MAQIISFKEGVQQFAGRNTHKVFDLNAHTFILLRKVMIMSPMLNPLPPNYSI